MFLVCANVIKSVLFLFVCLFLFCFLFVCLFVFFFLGGGGVEKTCAC